MLGGLRTSRPSLRFALASSRPPVTYPILRASVAVVGLLWPLALGGPAHAATFVVNSTDDVVDAAPGDGVCETATANGVCTLRAAIQEANAHPDADTIELDAATYTLTLPNGAFGENDAVSGDLDINA